MYVCAAGVSLVLLFWVMVTSERVLEQVESKPAGPSCGYLVKNPSDPNYTKGVAACQKAVCCCDIAGMGFEVGAFQDKQCANPQQPDHCNYKECSVGSQCWVTSNRDECYKLGRCIKTIPTKTASATCGKAGAKGNEYHQGVQDCKNKGCCCMFDSFGIEFQSFHKTQCAKAQPNTYNYGECRPGRYCVATSREVCEKQKTADDLYSLGRGIRTIPNNAASATCGKADAKGNEYRQGVQDCRNKGCCCKFDSRGITFNSFHRTQHAKAQPNTYNYGSCRPGIYCVATSRKVCKKQKTADDLYSLGRCIKTIPNKAASATCGKADAKGNEYRQGVQDCKNKGCCCKFDFLGIKFQSFHETQCAKAQPHTYNYGECRPGRYCVATSREVCEKQKTADDLNSLGRCIKTIPNNAASATCGKADAKSNEYHQGVQDCENKGCCCKLKRLGRITFLSFSKTQCANLQQPSIFHYGECRPDMDCVATSREVCDKQKHPDANYRDLSLLRSAQAMGKHKLELWKAEKLDMDTLVENSTEDGS